jgi:hypothetical protein
MTVTMKLKSDTRSERAQTPRKRTVKSALEQLS